MFNMWFCSVFVCSFCPIYDHVLIGSPAIQESRVATIQCLSGTGSLRVGAEFLKKHYHQVKMSPFFVCFWWSLNQIINTTVANWGSRFFSVSFSFQNRLGETIPKFSTWQACLWSTTVTMILQPVGLTSKVGFLLFHEFCLSTSRLLHWP